MSRIAGTEIIENPQTNQPRVLAERVRELIPQFQIITAGYTGQEGAEPAMFSRHRRDGSTTVYTPDSPAGQLGEVNLMGTKWFGTNPGSETDIKTSSSLNGFSERHATIGLPQIGVVAIVSAMGKTTYMRYSPKTFTEGVYTDPIYINDVKRNGGEVKIHKDGEQDRAIIQFLNSKEKLYIGVNENRENVKGQMVIYRTSSGRWLIQTEVLDAEGRIDAIPYSIDSMLDDDGVGVIRVGRKEAGNDIAWANNTTSSNHMTIAVVKGEAQLLKVEIVDHSTNGTVISSEPLLVRPVVAATQDEAQADAPPREVVDVVAQDETLIPTPAPQASAPPIIRVDTAEQAEPVLEQFATSQEVNPTSPPESFPIQIEQESAGTLSIERVETAYGTLYQSHVIPVTIEERNSSLVRAEAFNQTSADKPILLVNATTRAGERGETAQRVVGQTLQAIGVIFAKAMPANEAAQQIELGLRNNYVSDSLKALGYVRIEQGYTSGAEETLVLSYDSQGDMRIARFDSTTNKVTMGAETNELTDRVQARRVELNRGSVIIQATKSFWSALDDQKAEEFWNSIKEGNIENAIELAHAGLSPLQRQALSVSIFVSSYPSAEADQSTEA